MRKNLVFDLKKIGLILIVIFVGIVVQRTSYGDTNSRNLLIYWTDASLDKIQRANIDGTNVENLITSGLDHTESIELDVAGGKMYWTDAFTGKIQRANLDGTNAEDLITGLHGPRGIALDAVGGKMYWTDAGTDEILRANLNGSHIEALVTNGLQSPEDIALDVVGGKMYWTSSMRKIQRANLNGANVEDLVTGRSVDNIILVVCHI